MQELCFVGIVMFNFAEVCHELFLHTDDGKLDCEEFCNHFGDGAIDEKDLNEAFAEIDRFHCG